MLSVCPLSETNSSKESDYGINDKMEVSETFGFKKQFVLPQLQYVTAT